MSRYQETRPLNRKFHKGGSDDSQGNTQTETLNLGNLFDNFKRPNGSRRFKSEPVDHDVWQDMQAKEAASLEEAKKKKKRDAELPRTRSRTSAARRQNGSSSMGQEQPTASNAVVDLTEDHEDEVSHDNSTRRMSLPKKPASPLSKVRVKPLNVVQIQYMDNMQIPDEILGQAKSIYNNENVPFPPTLRLWAHLKHFVTNQPSAVLNLQLVMMMQAHIFHSSSQPNQVQQHNISQTTIPTPQQLQPFKPTGNIIRSLPDLNIFNGMRLVKVEAEVAKHDQQALLRAAPVAKSSPAPSAAPVRQHSAATTSKLNRVQNRSQDHTGRQRAHHPRPESPIDPALQDLVRPVDTMPDILPAKAPASHPHLVSIWDEKLLALPTNVHRHMNLLDTTVSIIARYDLQARSAIESFLDFAQVHHFFFVFKARDKHFHSWSIEREGNTITIGIERKNRAIRKINEAEIEACSSGRIDLSIQYEVTHPPESIDRVSNSGTDATSPPSSPLPKTFPVYALTGSTLLPSTPDLQTFLHETPPTRGADEHAHISHPLQSSLLDPSNTSSEYCHSLSILARYMQHTIFTSRAIDAEIQVVWGRKLRFDPVLGRVRPLWDYALKGAKTQKAKRERGEYNRPTVTPKKKKKKNDTTTSAEPDTDNGEKKDRSQKNTAHPGKGESKDYLKGSVLSRVAGNAIGQVKRRNLGNGEDKQFEPEDDIEAQETITLVRGAREEGVREPPRKKLKQEYRASGSEYSESETYSD